jgi:Zn ribbon nucleic-acid-binding protein
MKEAKCPRCQAIIKVTNNTGMVECYCGYIYELEDKKNDTARKKN